MKIALLEWSCGGGLLDTAAGHASRSLCAEGWQMLTRLADGLVRAGLDAIVPVDLRAVSQSALHARAHVVDMSHFAPATSDAVLRRWAEIAAECEYAWVVAPEIDGLLPKILKGLQNEGSQLLNCRGEFLSNCSNKRSTAAALTAAGIPHPPTTSLAELDEAWLATTSLRDGSVGYGQADQRWVIKPVAGAGGAGQRLVTHAQLLQMKHSTVAIPLGNRGAESSTAQSLPPFAPPNTRITEPGPKAAADWLVQPWLLGQPASCTAIVDAQGERHWLPLVSQDFKSSTGEWTPSFIAARGPTGSAPQYVGCTYPSAQLPRAAPHALLGATLDALGPGAFGPVGIDLLFDPAAHTWTVIEVNARCTSSLLAMASAYRGNLVGDIFQLLTQACDAPMACLSGELSPFQFRVAQA